MGKCKMMDIELPETKAVWAQGNWSRYEIAPVLAGFSTSFANGLRRVLLSSLPGSAITSVHIQGVQHDFQDISDIKEDVPDIVQNLKKVRLRSFSDHAVHMHLDVKREGAVTAADILVPSLIEIVNPETHIATLDHEEAHLRMDMVVNVGRGFVEADAQVVGLQPRGVIPIDAIYSPIVHVNFTIEHIQQDLDLIVLEITTDGTLSPDEALRQSACILCQQFSVLRDWYRSDVPLEPNRTLSDMPIPSSSYNRSIGDINLPARIVNSLKRHAIMKVGQVLEMDGTDLLYLRNIGEKALQEIYQCLRERDFLPKVRAE
jgi:DNA-directed RNA polymerase subunit alpha